MTFHVGSAREVEGRTGFAHLFEHLFFLDSENLGPGGLDRLMTRIGSSTNGSTSRDRTNYFEVVPIDGLEKALWAEADKLGFFINTVTESVVAKEKQVVKNEKRQSVDNRPYGHNNFVIDRAMYPEGHPYRWQVIGSLADLDAATLADAKEFHARWYGPNNATLGRGRRHRRRADEGMGREVLRRDPGPGDPRHPRPPRGAAGRYAPPPSRGQLRQPAAPHAVVAHRAALPRRCLRPRCPGAAAHRRQVHSPLQGHRGGGGTRSARVHLPPGRRSSRDSSASSRWPTPRRTWTTCSRPSKRDSAASNRREFPIRSCAGSRRGPRPASTGDSRALWARPSSWPTTPSSRVTRDTRPRTSNASWPSRPTT